MLIIIAAFAVISEAEYSVRAQQGFEWSKRTDILGTNKVDISMTQLVLSPRKFNFGLKYYLATTSGVDF